MGAKILSQLGEKGIGQAMPEIAEEGLDKLLPSPYSIHDVQITESQPSSNELSGLDKAADNIYSLLGLPKPSSGFDLMNMHLYPEGVQQQVANTMWKDMIYGEGIGAAAAKALPPISKTIKNIFKPKSTVVDATKIADDYIFQAKGENVIDETIEEIISTNEANLNRFKNRTQISKAEGEINAVKEKLEIKKAEDAFRGIYEKQEGFEKATKEIQSKIKSTEWAELPEIGEAIEEGKLIKSLEREIVKKGGIDEELIDPFRNELNRSKDRTQLSRAVDEIISKKDAIEQKKFFKSYANILRAQKKYGPTPKMEDFPIQLGAPGKPNVASEYENYTKSMNYFLKNYSKHIKALKQSTGMDKTFTKMEKSKLDDLIIKLDDLASPEGLRKISPIEEQRRVLKKDEKRALNLVEDLLKEGNEEVLMDFLESVQGKGDTEINLILQEIIDELLGK